ncbi:hypothetical protein [Aquimarina sediminis]|uniref:hypothetical protein n=1 Tax=Aquimarina sediminis TaxID=2070536 RepID=UPI000FFED40B|nr:hypothetical protein [Aquimarina sediminis]
MLKKEIYDKNRAVLIQNTPYINYEKNIFNLLQVSPDHFEQCVKSNKTYALLLRNWIKECLEHNITPNKVAKKIVRSKVLKYMGLKPRPRIGIGY